MISSVSSINKNLGRNNVNFTSSIIRAPKAYNIEKRLAKNAVNAEFSNNSFVAECVEKTIDIYKKIFGYWSFPRNISVKSTNDPLGYAYYSSYYDEIVIDKDKDCFSNKEKLVNEMKKHKNLFFFPDWFSSINPLHIFVHEMAHSAHFHNLEKKGNASSLYELRSTVIPTSIGRLITKFKLSKYAAKNMNEFMAERISKDITQKLTDSGTFWGEASEFDYANIFSKKWNYRYSSPQAYIDYFTQQVWNGDVEEAEEAGRIIDRYLKELDAQTVPSSIKELEESVSESAILSSMAAGVSNLFSNITHKLDKRNRLSLGNKL